MRIIKGTFKWDKESPIPTLSNINFQVKPGELVAVIGPVGSGKVWNKKKERGGGRAEQDIFSSCLPFLFSS